MQKYLKNLKESNDFEKNYLIKTSIIKAFMYLSCSFIIAYSVFPNYIESILLVVLLHIFINNFNKYKRYKNLDCLYKQLEKESELLIFKYLIKDVANNSKNKINNNLVLNKLKDYILIFNTLFAGLFIGLIFNNYNIIINSFKYLNSEEFIFWLNLLNTQSAPIISFGCFSVTFIFCTIIFQNLFEKKINFENNLIDKNQNLLKNLTLINKN
jgi:hypothetical protein